MERKVYKLIDKSLVLGTEVENNGSTIVVKTPLAVTQIMSPQGTPEIAFVPMDLIFSDASDLHNSVVFKKEHIIWEKPMNHFPNYEQNFVAQTTGIEMVTSGVLS